MKAIVVKYLAVTNTKPSRYKAYIQGHSVTVSTYDVEETWEKTPRRIVAEMLMEKLGWDDLEIAGNGMLPNGETAFILTLKQ